MILWKITTVCLDRGPISEEETQCLQCADNSRGKLCQECSPGYFEMNKTCVACMCNGHGDSNSCEAGRYFSTAHMHAFTGCFYVWLFDCSLGCSSFRPGGGGVPKNNPVRLGTEQVEGMVFERPLCIVEIKKKGHFCQNTPMKSYIICQTGILQESNDRV